MPRRKNGDRSLARKNQPSEKTPNSGLEVPIPQRRDFFDLLGKAATKLRGGDGSPSERGKGKRRTSPDQ
jgi:hypothetical protein